MTDLERLSVISRWLSRLCVALMVLLPASVLASWLYFDMFGPGLAARLGVAGTTDPQPVQVVLGILVMMIPVGIMVFGLWNLRRLLLGFGAGRIFTLENTRSLRIFAWSVLAVIVAQFFTDAALSVVLTFDNASGQRSLTLTFSTEQFLALFVGAVFVVIARVLEEGRKLADDNAAIL